MSGIYMADRKVWRNMGDNDQTTENDVSSGDIPPLLGRERVSKGTRRPRNDDPN